MAVYFGLTSNAQSISISQYISKNFSTCVSGTGYVYEGNATWPNPLVGGQPHGGTGSYDDASWAYCMLWVIKTLQITDPAAAQRIIRRYCYCPDPSQEWYRRDGGSYTSEKRGNTNNISSIYQSLAAIALT